MRYALCLIRPDRQPFVELTYAPFTAACREAGILSPQWITSNGFAAAFNIADTHRGPLLARTHSLIGIGDVRLDNREEVLSWCTTPSGHMSDLSLALTAIEQLGPTCVARLLGDFALAAWNPARREVLLARDAFGVKTLYYTIDAGLLAVSTRADLLRIRDGYDLAYIGDYLCGMEPVDRTIYSNVTPVPAGCLLSYRNSAFRTTRFWSVDEFEIDYGLSEVSAAERFRGTLTEAVKCRLSNSNDTWSQLSGGLDSSSVVSVAQYLAARGDVPFGIAGTVTYVDSLGGDEREYADAVLQAYSVTNHPISDYWYLQDDEDGPSRTDLPTAAYPFFSRSRRMCAVVRSGGGRILLSGQGSDHYLTGNRLYIADLLAAGHIARAAHEATRWAVEMRQSIWRVLFDDAVVPNLSRRLQRLLAPERHIPAWLDQRYAKRLGLVDRLPTLRRFEGRLGSKFRSQIAFLIRGLPIDVNRGVDSELLDMRYPFLYRPLVELGLTLPPSLRTRPGVTKYILRSALRGILPEKVRLRQSKGTIDGRLEWSLKQESDRIDQLLRTSVLAELGCVDLPALQKQLAAAQAGDGRSYGDLMAPLSLEAWFAARRGTWRSRQPSPKRRNVTSHAYA
jgi:asparagine synthase (glutamine-hydrolysing)